MVRQIPLTQGKFALVDDEDYEWLSQWKWCAHFDNGNWYALRWLGENSKPKHITMHAQILGTPKDMESDHKDRDGLNNQRYNLRVCTHTQNVRNRRKNLAKCSSEFKGIHWAKRDKRWRARIEVDGKAINLGSFISEIKAALTYDKAAQKYFGDFAYKNFIEV